MEETKNQKKEEKKSFLDFFLILLKRKKMIFTLTLAVAVIMFVICLILPAKYQGEALILAPQQVNSEMAIQMLGAFGGAASAFGNVTANTLAGSLGIKNPNDVYVGQLTSREVYDHIIDKFGLRKLYEHDRFFLFRWLLKYHREDCEKDLDGNVSIIDNDNGIINVDVYDKDPKRATDMANEFVEELRIMNDSFSHAEAARRRGFFQEQTNLAKVALTKAETELKVFQEKTGALKLDAQTAAIVDGIATLQAQIAAQEVQIKVLKTFSTLNNPDLQKAIDALRGLQVELRKLEAKGDILKANPVITTERLPSVSEEYVRKMRDFKFYDTFYQILLNQLQLAVSDEQREATVIPIVSKAIMPEKKYSPKILLVTALGLGAGLFLAIFLAFVLEYVNYLEQDPLNKEKIEKVKNQLPFSRQMKSGAKFFWRLRGEKDSSVL